MREHAAEEQGGGARVLALPRQSEDQRRKRAEADGAERRAERRAGGVCGRRSAVGVGQDARRLCPPRLPSSRRSSRATSYTHCTAWGADEMDMMCSEMMRKLLPELERACACRAAERGGGVR